MWLRSTHFCSLLSQATSLLANSLMTKVTAGLDDDLNTQPAIALLSEATKSINQFCNSKQVEIFCLPLMCLESF